jgi:TRAP-type mannitol/chloroaromatic compound transport system substrate-binding protein
MTKESKVAKRRRWLTSAVAGAMAWAANPASANRTLPKTLAATSAPKQLDLVTAWTKNFSGMTQSLDRFATRVYELSEGSVRIQWVHQDQSNMSALELLEAVAAGKIDMAHSTSYYWTRRSVGFNFFATLPFGMLPNEHYAWLRYGGGLALWQKLAAQHGVHVLPCGNTGVQMGGWFRERLRSVDDLKGLKIRYPGIGGEIFKRMGAIPTMLPASELRTALSDGRLDAAEWVSPWGDLDLEMHKVANHYYFPGIHEPGHTLELLINPAVWSGLTAHQRKVIEMAAWLEFSDMHGMFNHENAKALQDMVKLPKIQVLRFPNDIITQYRKLTPKVIEDAVSNDAVAQTIWKSYSSYMRQQMRWAELSDRSYWQARYQ